MAMKSSVEDMECYPYKNVLQLFKHQYMYSFLDLDFFLTRVLSSKVLMRHACGIKLLFIIYFFHFLIYPYHRARMSKHAQFTEQHKVG